MQLLLRLTAYSEADEADFNWDYPPDRPEKTEEEIETYGLIRLG
jgi:hypothetical protein